MFTSTSSTPFTRLLLLVSALIGPVALVAPAHAANGTFLFDTPGTLGDPGVIDLTTWKAVKEFKVDHVMNDGLDVGRIHFSYDTWDGKVTSNNNPTWGAAIGGGFFQTKDEGVKKIDGFDIRWIQSVTADVVGDGNVWKAPKASEYPDTGSSTTSPLYPNQSLPGGIDPAPAAPTAPFQDFPNRYALKDSDNKDIANHWLAELALVGINSTDKEVRIIGSFLWGFDIRAGGGVDQSQPRLWTSNATSSFLNTFTNAFCGNDGAGLNTVKGSLWTFNSKPVFEAAVPTPGAITLLALAAGLLVKRRRAA